MKLSDCANMTIETERLLLRPWRESDAEALFRYASDPEVGPSAGWPVHTSVENSREIIKTVLSEEGTFAVVLKETMEPVGSVGLMLPRLGDDVQRDSELEIGYWIGKPYWGQGLIPEAVRALQKLAFTELECTVLWCAYFDGNVKSARVQEKCGFTYHHTKEEVYWAAMDKVLTEHFTRLTKEDWAKTL